MDQAELLAQVTALFARRGVRYLVTSSVATIAYREPRLTIDVDTVVRLREEHVGGLVAALSETDLHFGSAHIKDAAGRRTQFNVLDPASGLKVDGMVASPRMSRAARQHSTDHERYRHGELSAHRHPHEHCADPPVGNGGRDRHCAFAGKR